MHIFLICTCMVFGGRVAFPYCLFALLAYMAVGKEFVMKSLIIFPMFHTKHFSCSISDIEPAWISVYTMQMHVFESKRKISIVWHYDFLVIAFSKMPNLAFWKWNIVELFRNRNFKNSSQSKFEGCQYLKYPQNFA